MWKSQLVPMWRYCTQSRILCSEQFTVVVLVIVTAFRSSLLYKPNLLLLFVVRSHTLVCSLVGMDGGVSFMARARLYCFGSGLVL